MLEIVIARGRSHVKHDAKAIHDSEGYTSFHAIVINALSGQRQKIVCRLDRRCQKQV